MDPGATPAARPIIGRPFETTEAALETVLAGLGPFAVAASEPPWSVLAPRLPAPTRVYAAGDMDLHRLEALAAEADGAATIVGVGGGAALDTAKFLAWRRGLPLLQAPTITSVDAAFTDAIGVRIEGRVRYVGRVRPLRVALDLPLIRAAPPALNRAGIGDVLSCHTGLHDWRAASAAGHGPPWRDDLAALGRGLLAELEARIDAIGAVDEAGVRFLADAYRRIGAACAEAGHSRFEEGSEHFLAYALEAATGLRFVHGEIVACCAVAMATVQANAPERVAGLVRRARVRAHPRDLGLDEPTFREALLGLSAYARAEGLDVSTVDLEPVTPATAAAAWAAVTRLPRAAAL